MGLVGCTHTTYVCIYICNNNNHKEEIRNLIGSWETQKELEREREVKIV